MIKKFILIKSVLTVYNNLPVKSMKTTLVPGLLRLEEIFEKYFK